ncbi:MAG: HAD family phosphatase [Fuerstiella sp.]
MPIRTCFFDMGNVLVHFSHDRMCQNIAAACDMSVDRITEMLMESGLQWQLECGEISEAEFHAKFQTELKRSIDPAALKHAAADIFWLNDSIVPLVDELRQLGMRLVLLSNTSVTHLNFIQQNFDILDRFDALTTSFQAGALKPHAAIYQDALSRANCEPQDCFYTDDIKDYVKAARTFGINAEVYTDTNQTRQTLRSLGVPVQSGG